MVYENVLIGHFIYTLGVLAGKRAGFNSNVTDSINFFQQTPTDKIVGDLLASWSDRLFIIEFKRSASQLPDELKKWKRRELPKVFLADKTVSDISKKCHFIGYGIDSEIVIDDKKKTQQEFKFQSYYSLVMEKLEEKKSLNIFINEMLSDDQRGLRSTEEFGRYLAVLHELCELSEPSSAASGGKSLKPICGAVVSFSKKGEVVMIQYKSYFELANLLGMKIELALQIEQQVTKQHQFQNPIQLETKHSKGQSMSM